jgi:K+ transporter
MKKTIRFFLVILSQILLVMVFCLSVSFVWFLTNQLRKITGGGFWSLDFPAVLLSIIIIIGGAVLYTKWSKWVNKKLDTDEDFLFSD